MLNARAVNIAKVVLRVLLGLFMVFAAITHFLPSRTAFYPLVPDYLPFGEDVVVLASGVVELLLGVAMFPGGRWKRHTGLALGIFFVLVFPGNLHQYMNGINTFGLDTDTARLTRLFFQPVLILWAFWSTDALSLLRKGSSVSAG